MAYIFMDESGCLGFDFSKARTSENFIVTFLFCENKRQLERIVKRTFRSFSDKEKRKHPGVLHCTKELAKTRLKLLSQLKGQDVSIMCIRLNKRKVYTQLQDEKPVLYNYITNILLDRIITKKLIPTEQKILLIASKRETNHLLNENFKSYIKDKNHAADIEISIKTPAEEKTLQVVDFVSWAIFRKHEKLDESYYSIIKNLIVEEHLLFS